MPEFSYRALDPDGQVVEGSLEAREERQVIERLRQQSLLPLRIVSAGSAAGQMATLRQQWRRRLPLEDLVRFSHELAVLLRAGLPLDRGLEIVRATVRKPGLTVFLDQISRDLQGGKLFSEALERTRLFPPLYLSLVRAGEAGGFLEVALERLAEYLEGVREFRSNLLTALIYPVILGVVGGLAIIFMLLYVVPRFEVFFAEMRQGLFWSTQLLLTASQLLNQYWWLLPVFLGLLGLTWWRLRRVPKLRLLWDRYKLKLPVVGALFQRVAAVFFTKTLGTLLSNGVALVPALDLSSKAVANLYVQEGLGGLTAEVQKGQPLSRLLKRIGLLPEICVQLIAVGEESGRLADMLLEATKTLEGEVKSAVKKMLAWLEPILILGMGLLVAFIIVSLLLPILNLYEFSL